MTTPTIERPTVACGRCDHAFHRGPCERFGCNCERGMPPEAMTEAEHRANRLLHMVKFFEAGGQANCTTLAQRFGRSRRSIQRDLMFVERWVPLEVLGEWPHISYRRLDFDA